MNPFTVFGVRVSGVRCYVAGKVVAQMKNILVVDDDEDLCKLLVECLRLESFNCSYALSGNAGMEMLQAADWDLLILDIMLPGYSGFDVLRFLRESERLAGLPVLMLTAKADEMDRIAGLEAGADDYLTKPFSQGELAARIRAILRRAALARRSGQARNSSGSLKIVGDILLNSASLRVSVDDAIIPITALEFRILEILLENQGNIVPRETLAEQALKRTLHPFERSLDIHISRIRSKLGPHRDGSPRIRSIRGEGYVYITPEEE